MKKKIGSIHLYEAAAVITLSLLLIIIGSFCDLSLSSTLFKSQNIYSNLISFIGKLPLYLAIGISGVCLFLSFKTDTQKWVRILGWVLLFLLPLASGLLYGYDDLSESFGKIAGIITGVCIIGVLSALFYLVLRKTQTLPALKAGISLLIISVLILLICYLLKKAGARPRYFWIATNGEVNFRNWWVFDYSLKSSFPDATERVFESFPSGHMAAASVALVYPVISDCIPNQKKWVRRVFDFVPLIALVFIILVGFGRLLDGSHFLSDIGFGLLLGAGISYLVVILLWTPIKHSAKDEKVSSEQSENKVEVAEAEGNKLLENEPEANEAKQQ